MFDKPKDDDRKRSPSNFENPLLKKMQIEIFVEKLENEEWFDENGDHLLHQVAEANLPDLIDRIFSMIKCVDVRNRCNRTPLHQAAYWGNLEAGSTLLKFGADIEAQDTNGATPIHFAAEFGYPEMVRFLIENGANANCQQKYLGNTPLHYAASRAHFDVVEVLLKSGANPELRNKSNFTPLDLATSEENYKSIEVLKRYSRK